MPSRVFEVHAAAVYNIFCKSGQVKMVVDINEGGTMEHVYEALGIIGGVFLSICTIPQLWHMYHTQDARELQKRFLVLYLFGTVFTFAYLVIKDAWAAWITMVLEVLL